METRRSQRLQLKDASIQENGLDSPVPKKRKVATKTSDVSTKVKDTPVKPIKSAYFSDENSCECLPSASKRRTRKSKSSYFESPVESDDESDYKPDSDGAEPPAKSRKKAVKRKPTYESESDSSSDESPSKSAPKARGAVKKQNSIFKLESESSSDESEKPKSLLPKSVPVSNQKNSFESESDSSSDEFVKAPESLLNLPKTESVDSSNADASNDDLDNDPTDPKPTEYFDFTSLVSQVTEAAKATEKPPEVEPEEKKPSNKETPEKKSKRGSRKAVKKASPSSSQVQTEQLEVCELLAMGENTDLSAKDIKETVANSSQGYEIPNQVEVLLDAPPLKKKKRCNDLEIALRRRLNNIKREHQVYIHKVHILCYIAHGHYLNSILNSADVLSVALSLLPSDKCYPPKRMNMEYLEDLLNWFNKKIKCKQILVSNEFKDLKSALQNQLEIREALSKTHFCFMFLCLLRALGIQCRLVVNLNVLPIKPSADQLLPINQKSEEEKAASSSTKKNKTPAKPASKSKTSEKSKKSEMPSQEKKKTPNASSTKSGAKQKDSSYFKEEKPTRRSGRQTQSSSKYFEGNDDEENDSKVKSRSSKSRSKSKKKDEPFVEEMSSTDDSDFEDFVSPKKKKIDRRVLSPDDNTNEKSAKDVKADKPKQDNKMNYWIEVYLEAEEKWFCVDVAKESYHCSKQLYNNASHPVRYVLAWNNDQSIKDVTRRYVPQYLTVTRKLRVDDDWWYSTMKPYESPPTPRNKEEDEELDKILEELPIPASISECKNHPLYAMKRHLLKFQAIYPPDAIPVGYIKGEPVYSRLCVQQLHGREMWIKEAKVVKLHETPYKIVKGRPQKSKLGISEPPKDLELFGSWQVEDYVPPAAENGKVPRNGFGNVELFKMCMLPKGTVYLQIPGLQRIANKLNIDCAAAITGFEYSTNGWSYPVKDGFVVCEEFKDILVDAFNQELEEAEKKEKQKRQERVYANWRCLIKGLLIREKLKRKYNFGGDAEASTSKADAKNKSK